MTNCKRLKPLAEHVLIGEIVTQAKFAEKAADQLAKASDATEVWGSIQAFLGAAANVSKILWPARKENAARGKQLRDLLDLDDEGLLSNRTIRNHFEHYDERIDDWFNNTDSAVYMDARIDPFESTPWSVPRIFHRSYNPNSQKLSFRDESIDLAALRVALAEIRKKCSFFASP